MIQLPEGISRKDLETIIDLFNSWGKKHQTEGMIEALSYYLTISGWKQRAEAAEDALAEEKRITSKLIQDRAVMARECNAFEEKLAELDKQDPYAYAYRFKGKQGLSFRKLDIDKCDSRIMPLFTRPAPAINLAELVPEPMADWKVKIDPHGAKCWEACRAAMLRNIEGQSK